MSPGTYRQLFQQIHFKRKVGRVSAVKNWFCCLVVLHQVCFVFILPPGCLCSLRGQCNTWIKGNVWYLWHDIWNTRTVILFNFFFFAQLCQVNEILCKCSGDFCCFSSCKTDFLPKLCLIRLSLRAPCMWKQVVAASLYLYRCKDIPDVPDVSPPHTWLYK